jgi:cytidylate kinase
MDTGMMYRAVTWAALSGYVPLADHAALTALARHSEVREDREGDAIQVRFLVSGHDVTPFLRQPEVDGNVSVVAQVRGVREALVERQRNFARAHNVVMVGRDIGTVVIPDATLKVFITASPEERARRRHAELVAAGVAATYDSVLSETVQRDRLDSERELSPLKPAQDAVVISTDALTVEQVVDRVIAEFRKKAAHA